MDLSARTDPVFMHTDNETMRSVFHYLLQSLQAVESKYGYCVARVFDHGSGSRVVWICEARRVMDIYYSLKEANQHDVRFPTLTTRGSKDQHVGCSCRQVASCVERCHHVMFRLLNSFWVTDQLFIVHFLALFFSFSFSLPPTNIKNIILKCLLLYFNGGKGMFF